MNDLESLADFRKRHEDDAPQAPQGGRARVGRRVLQRGDDGVERRGKPSREILRIAAEQQTDLIVVGVQGRGAANLMFFGSTTNHVVREATCPVLTVRRR